MKDRQTGQWRPRKSWGGAGKDAHKVGGLDGAPAPRTRKPTGRPKGRPKGRRTQPVRPRPEPLMLVEVEGQEPDGEEEFTPFLGSDPAPAWQRDDAPPAPPDTEQSGGFDLRTEVEAWIALGWSIPAETLATIDPYCFGPLVDDQTGPLVIRAFADIAMQSPRVAEFIASKSGLRPYIQLAAVFKPVIANAWRHHISRKVEVEIDREAMTYTVKSKERDYSQYPAA